jgi:hypothetical protein
MLNKNENLPFSIPLIYQTIAPLGRSGCIVFLPEPISPFLVSNNLSFKNCHLYSIEKEGDEGAMTVAYNIKNF